MRILFEAIIFYLFLLFNCFKSEPNPWNLLSESLDENLAIGTVPNLSLKYADFYINNLRYKVKFGSISSSMKTMRSDGDIISGNGITFKPTKNPVYIDIIPPQNKSNVCGLIIGSGRNGDGFIKNVKIFWRKSSNSWNIVANPFNGDLIFNLNFKLDSEYKVVLIDQVPADEVRIEIPFIDGTRSNIQISIIHECKFSPKIKIDDCYEKFENNAKFKNLPSDGPFSISCPTECKIKKRCSGFNIYSEDSPICMAAYQRFGNCGDGDYFLYRIPIVTQFDSEVNPQLNNGVFCGKSTLAGPGITFNRNFYDDANRENERQQ